MVEREPIVGRADELDLVRSWLDDGRSGVVEGAAGIGKSALVEAACSLAPPVHTRWIQGLRYLREVPLLPLRLALPTIAADEPLDSVLERLLEQLGGAVLIVDDLHFCDRDTLAVVTEVAMRSPVLATVRGAGGRWDEARRSILSDGELLVVTPLSPAAARELVGALRPGAPASDVATWVELSGGNPYELRLRALGGDVKIVDHETVVAALPPPLVEALASVAAGAGASAGLGAAARDDLLAAHVITVDADGTAWPLHDRLGEAALAAVDVETRRAIHRGLARSAHDPAIRAVNFAAAGDDDGAAEAARQAQLLTPSRTSWATFLQLEARHTKPPNPDLSLDAADALSLVARYDEAIECLPDFPGPGDAAARAAVVHARVGWALTDIPAARAAIESGLDDPGAADRHRSELLTVRSRIRCRVDWDLPGAIEDADHALELAGDDTRLQSAARSSRGLARFISGTPDWSEDLEIAGRLAVTDVDIHEALSIYDTAVFGHLLTGDPARGRVLAEEMIAFTELVSADWNGYFRAVSLVLRLHVDGDHDAVRAEAEVLGRRRLSVKAAETRRTVLALALADSGDEIAGLDVAEAAWVAASDDSARATVAWATADTAWLVGDAERAFEVAMSALELPTTGYPGSVNATLMGHWAARDLGRPVPDELTAAVASGFPNLAGAQREADALRERDPDLAAQAFGEAAALHQRVSRRAALRARWAEVTALIDAGRTADALAALEALAPMAEDARIPWLDRRIAAARRRLGTHATTKMTASTTGASVMTRVARGHTTAVIARGLCLSPTTIETHVRDAIRRTGARTRLEAALASAPAPEGTPASFVVEESGDGSWLVRSLDLTAAERRPELPRVPSRFSGEIALVGPVGDDNAVERALVAVARGAGLEVSVTNPAALTALVDGLGRLGTVRRAEDDVEGRAADVDLDDIDRSLVRALAAGQTLTEAASTVGYSRRQVQRRLQTLRERVGVPTNAELVAILAGRA